VCFPPKLLDFLFHCVHWCRLDGHFFLCISVCFLMFADYVIQLTPFGINVFTSFTVEIELHLVPLTHGVFKV
jgi:hypothetical protein